MTETASTVKNRRLASDTESLLSESKEVRIKALHKPRFFYYSEAEAILAELEELLHQAPSNRPRNLCLLGRSNNGKTELLKLFCKKHPSIQNEDEDISSIPVIYVQSPPKASASGIVNEILSSFMQTSRFTSTFDTKLERVKALLETVKVKMIIIDEISALASGTERQVFETLNTIKNISNALMIPIVLAGTEAAKHRIDLDTQYQSRFPVRVLPRWEDGQEFKQLVATIEQHLPLQHPSKLHSAKTRSLLMQFSDNGIGGLMQLLRSCAEYAIKHDIEMIDENVILNCDFVTRASRSNLDRI